MEIKVIKRSIELDNQEFGLLREVLAKGLYGDEKPKLKEEERKFGNKILTVIDNMT